MILAVECVGDPGELAVLARARIGSSTAKNAHSRAAGRNAIASAAVRHRLFASAGP